MIRKQHFRDLLDGQVFSHNGVKWIVCAGIHKKTAYRLDKTHISATFDGACIVEISMSEEPDVWDLVDDEAVLREIPGYQEYF